MAEILSLDEASGHLRIPVADTVLDCNDSGGSGQPILFLNGAFSSQGAWKKVIGRLGKDHLCDLTLQQLRDTFQAS